MKTINIKGAISLCAVILIIAMIIISVPVAFPVYAEDEPSDEVGKYKYAVTIEFGSMTFCYDYGIWDANEMRYRSDPANQAPANGTKQGYPGWYGFDGTANRISVKYSNVNESDSPSQNRKLSVMLDYRGLYVTEGRVIENVAMDFYSDPALTIPFAQNFTVPHTSPEDENAKTVLYASLRGTPTENGGKYLSESFAPVGILTVRVGETFD